MPSRESQGLSHGSNKSGLEALEVDKPGVLKTPSVEGRRARDQGQRPPLSPAGVRRTDPGPCALTVIPGQLGPRDTESPEVPSGPSPASQRRPQALERADSEVRPEACVVSAAGGPCATQRPRVPSFDSDPEYIEHSHNSAVRRQITRWKNEHNTGRDGSPEQAWKSAGSPRRDAEPRERPHPGSGFWGRQW